MKYSLFLLHNLFIMLTAYRRPVYVTRRPSYYQRRRTKKLYRAVKQLRSIRRAQKSFRDEFQRLHPKGSAESINTFGATYGAAIPRQRLARRMFNYRGQGDYWSDFKKGGWFSQNAGMGAALRGLGGAIGSYVPGGSALGTAAGGAVSKWLGFGDYTTPASGNQLMGDSQTPVTVNNSDDNTGDIYLSHTEFIGNVVATASAAGSSTFQQTVFELNPGLPASFPWLSQIASNFELYDFQGLMYQYKPNSGESGASSNNLGKIIMATQYDPDAQSFINSIEMQNYDYANSTKPSCGLVHGVETAQTQQAVNMMYVRTRSVTRDKIFTDLGKLVVATEGIPFSGAGTQILGELWVTYRIKLSRATLYSALLGLTIPIDNFRLTATASSMAGAVTTSTVNSGSWSIVAGGLNNFTVTGATNLVAGCYLVSVYFNKAIAFTTASNLAFGSLVNCAQTNSTNGTVYSESSPAAVGETRAAAKTIIEVTNPSNIGSSFQISLATQPVAAGDVTTIVITQVPCTVRNTLQEV